MSKEVLPGARLIPSPVDRCRPTPPPCWWWIDEEEEAAGDGFPIWAMLAVVPLTPARRKTRHDKRG